MREPWIVNDTPVSALMADAVVQIAPDATLLEVADALTRDAIGVLVVSDGARVVGIVSERDVVAAVAARMPLDRTSAKQIATTKVAWCDADSTVCEVANEMTERYVRHVLVERDGVPVGVVSGRDLLGYYASEGADLDFD
jgi:CBS domain-containing protein